MPGMSSHETNPDQDFLPHLRDLGREAARDWIAPNFGTLGHRPTFDPESRFSEPLRHPQCAPAAHAESAA